jgi:GT2 family glycosyltransferase
MAESVSLVVINYQGRRWLPRCLASLARLQGDVLETIVIDNASGDGSPEVAVRNFPGVRVVRNRRNVGFAKACNQAMRLTRGDAVAIFNNDLEVAPEWLTAMQAVLGAGPSIAACTSKLRMQRPREALWGAAGGMNWQGFGYDRGHGEWDTGQYDRAEPVFGACGAAMLLRRRAFEAVGPFDETFFMYHEDVDWCWRAWLQGFQVWYVPQAVAYHKGEASSRRTLGAQGKARLGQRHRLRSLLKCYEGVTLRRYAAQPDFWMYGQPSWRRLLGLLPPLLWNLWRLPSALAARRDIQRRRIRSDADLQGLIGQGAVPRVPPRLIEATRVPGRHRPRVAVVDMGINDPAVLGSGWYEPEAAPHDPELSIRWSQASGVLQLWQPAGARRLFLHLYSLAQSSGCPLSGRVLVNGTLIGRFASIADEWLSLAYDLPGPGERWITVTLAVRHTWRPCAAFSGADRRELGVALRRAGCVVPQPPARLPPTPRVSVVIPTHNRAAVLAMALRGLLEQTYPADRLEVIVSDDGSSDGTPAVLDEFAALFGGRLRVLRQPPTGAAAARNRGLRAADGDLILFLDDDVVPGAGLVSEHVATHRRWNRARDVAVVGYTRWPHEIRLTAFLHYLNDWGPQFSYRFMIEDMELPFCHFYAANLSLTREVCGTTAAFTEWFPNLWDDTELGYRLAQRGLRLYYNPRAVGYHHNVRSVPAFLARQRKAGRYAVLLSRWYPELTPWLRTGRATRRRSWPDQVAMWRRRLRHAADVPAPMRWHHWRIARAFDAGIREGRREWVLAPPRLPESTAPADDRQGLPEPAMAAAGPP